LESLFLIKWNGILWIRYEDRCSSIVVRFESIMLISSDEVNE